MAWQWQLRSQASCLRLRWERNVAISAASRCVAHPLSIFFGPPEIFSAGRPPMDVLSTQHNFRGPSLKDLLDARELYHWH